MLSSIKDAKRDMLGHAGEESGIREAAGGFVIKREINKLTGLCRATRRYYTPSSPSSSLRVRAASEGGSDQRRVGRPAAPRHTNT